MPDPTVEDILTAIAPQFDPNPGRAVIIQLATARTPAGTFPPGITTSNVIALLAAHMLTLSEQSNNGGPVVSETVGPLRQDYATPWGAHGPMTDLATTVFGRELQEFRKSYIFNPTTRMNPLPFDPTGEL